MFKSSERINRQEFAHFFKIGKRFSSTIVTLIYLPSASLKVSSVVGKKVAKEAVARNRLRRRVYAATRRYFFEKSIKTGVFIFILKPEANKLTRLEVGARINEVLAQITKAR